MIAKCTAQNHISYNAAISACEKGRQWHQALQLMEVGSKWKLTIPPELAYGKRGAGRDIGPDETLVFEVELLKIN